MSNRVVFIGSTRRGYLALQELERLGADLVGVVSLRQHAHEKERYEEPMGQWCRERNIPCRETAAMQDANYEALFRDEWQADWAVAVGLRVLLPKEIWSAPTHGTVGVHDSLLPQYRGFAPLNWAVINGETVTGVSLFQLDDDMDTGELLGQVGVPIPPDAYAREIYESVCQATVQVLSEAWPGMASGAPNRTPQSEAGATYCCARNPEDGRIRWEATTRDIFNLIRGLSHPFPGAFTRWEEGDLTVWKAEIVADAPEYMGRVPGRVVGVDRETGHVDVLTGDGVLRLVTVEPDGADSEGVPARWIKSVRGRLG